MSNAERVETAITRRCGCVPRMLVVPVPLELASTVCDTITSAQGCSTGRVLENHKAPHLFRHVCFRAAFDCLEDMLRPHSEIAERFRRKEHSSMEPALEPSL